MRSCTGWILPVFADVDECSKPDICGAGGQCVNLPGSYKCECHSGFRSKSHRHLACEGTKTLFMVTEWRPALTKHLLRVRHSDIFVSVRRVCWWHCVTSLLNYSRHKWVFESRDVSQWAMWEHAGLVRVCSLLAWSRGPQQHLLRSVKPGCTAACHYLDTVQWRVFVPPPAKYWSVWKRHHSDKWPVPPSCWHPKKPNELIRRRQDDSVGLSVLGLTWANSVVYWRGTSLKTLRLKVWCHDTRITHRILTSPLRPVSI